MANATPIHEIHQGQDAKNALEDVLREGARQLLQTAIEEEIAAGSWVVVPVRGAEADTETPGVLQDFVLDTSSATMWTEALESLGIDPVRLVGLNRSVGLH